MARDMVLRPDEEKNWPIIIIIIIIVVVVVVVVVVKTIISHTVNTDKLRTQLQLVRSKSHEKKRHFVLIGQPEIFTEVGNYWTKDTACLHAPVIRST